MHKNSRQNSRQNSQQNSSWEPVGGWYRQIVGKEGHYYHQQVILPKLIPLIKSGKEVKVLDVGCGQGILSRALGKEVLYSGVDLSPSLIKEAIKQNRNPHHQFLLGDATRPLPVKEHDYTHAVFLLSLQNMSAPGKALKEASDHLKAGGTLILVLNHPCFRIPRQSSWGVDEKQKVQYRRIYRYLSSMEIPIQASPSKGGASAETLSYHHPLSAICTWIREAGLSIETIEEWCSDKESEGKGAKMENRARTEIPLFMTLLATKH